MPGRLSRDWWHNRVNPAGLGVESYVDSPLFIEIILALLAIFFGAYAWLKMQQPSPNVFAALALVAAVILCVVAMAAQKRRTFLFDTTARTLTWTSRGLGERAAGTTDFKDVRITLDPSMDNGYTSYRIMVTTPAGSWPLSSGYDANQERIKAQAARLCALLGQSADGILADSFVQLTKENKLISAAKLLGRERGVSTTEAFGSIVESQESKPESP